MVYGILGLERNDAKNQIGGKHVRQLYKRGRHAPRSY